MTLWGMSPFEIVAAVFGIVSVFLSTRQNIWSWPTSLINVSMSALVYFQQRLYATMALQGIFFAVSLYGWYEWRYGGEKKRELKVSKIPPTLGLGLIGLTALGTLGTWYVLSQTPDSHPLIDAIFFAVSVVAQWMMARKYVECWPVWVAINCIAVPFFFWMHSYPFMIQYAVFLVLAIMGWRHWKASLTASS
jgi:nicotinamide mononucleotide transporter